MYRQSPGRSLRSKGIKVKHVLQICLLLAVCFWLIYQFKHSYEKKKELDASDTETKISFNIRTSDEVIKLGRKDLLPKSEETAKITEKQDEEETEEETGGEDEERKHEEEDQEEDKTDEDKDEERGDGNDEKNEHKEEKSDMEEDNEKEGEEGDEKENEENDVEDEGQKSQTKKVSSLEDHDRDGVARNTHEAREENYKGDDASSAVTHDTQTTENGNVDNSNENAENENEKKLDNDEELNASANTTGEKVENGETAKDGGKENSDENAEVDSSKHENSEELNSGQKSTVKLENVERAENVTSSNVTSKETGSEGFVFNSFVNSTVTVESNNQLVPNNNSAEAITDSSLLNGAELKSDSIHAQNTSEKATTSGEGSDPNQASFDSTGTLAPEKTEKIPEEYSNSSSNSEIAESENNTTSFSDSSISGDSSGLSDSEPVTDASLKEHSDTSYEEGGIDESSGFLKTENKVAIDVSQNEHLDTENEVAIDVSQNEHLDTSNEREEINESSETSETENLDNIQHDPIDSYESSLHQEEKDVQTGLDALPDIRTDGSDSEAVSAE